MTLNTLPGFILARVAVDEASVEVPEWYCTDSARGEAWGTRGDTCPLCDGYMFEGTESATEDAWVHHLDDMHDRRRVLAQCAAYRRIVALHSEDRENLFPYPVDYECTGTYDTGMADPESCSTLLTIASIWSDHPDFNEEWKS